MKFMKKKANKSESPSIGFEPPTHSHYALEPYQLHRKGELGLKENRACCSVNIWTRPIKQSNEHL